MRQNIGKSHITPGPDYGGKVTWASWLAQEGVPLSVLQELGGWSSSEMVKRYAHLTIGHLAPYAERIAAGTIVAQRVVKAVPDVAN